LNGDWSSGLKVSQNIIIQMKMGIKVKTK